MPRAVNATNTPIFDGGHVLPHAEKILRIMENSHDNLHLLEMNGEKCTGRQISKLR